MKITKRLSIEFLHREVTITVAGAALHVQDGEPEAASIPRVCPTCGSPWITIVSMVDGVATDDPDRVHRALRQAGLHVQVTSAGKLNICQRSFEEIKEKP